MTHVARYIIVLDRYDDDDYAASQRPDGGHDGTAETACIQVASELQEAMTELGTPAGFFNVIERRVFTDPPGMRVSDPEATAENLCRSLGIERLMQDDPHE